MGKGAVMQLLTKSSLYNPPYRCPRCSRNKGEKSTDYKTPWRYQWSTRSKAFAWSSDSKTAFICREAACAKRSRVSNREGKNVRPRTQQVSKGLIMKGKISRSLLFKRAKRTLQSAINNVICLHARGFDKNVLLFLYQMIAPLFKIIRHKIRSKKHIDNIDQGITEDLSKLGIKFSRQAVRARG